MPPPAAGGVPGRRLTLHVHGTAQMTLALPDDGRLRAWSLAPDLPPPRISPFAPSERLIFAFLSAGGEAAAPSEPRTWELWMEFEGSGPDTWFSTMTEIIRL